MNIDRLIDECNKFTDVPNSMLRWVYIALENVKYKATLMSLVFLQTFYVRN